MKPKAAVHPGDIISEWWARSFRNGGRDNVGIGGRDNPGMVGDLRRNQQHNDNLTNFDN